MALRGTGEPPFLGFLEETVTAFARTPFPGFFSVTVAGLEMCFLEERDSDATLLPILFELAPRRRPRTRSPMDFAPLDCDGPGVCVVWTGIDVSSLELIVDRTTEETDRDR